jgi:hypothetical protein
MATTIGDTVSRIRNIVKGVKEDAFLTDRFLYSLVLKYAKLYIRRQDTENKIMRFQSLFEPLPCVDLIEVDKIEACCNDIKTNCTIMRTKNKLPVVLEGAYGPLFRTVSSMDGSQECFKTYPTTYASMTRTTNFRYNKNKYYWYLNGYLYFPNISWEAVRIEGLWDESINMYTCDGDECQPRQDDQTHFPEYLFAEIEQNVLKDLTLLIQAPVEAADDKQSPLRS